MKVRLNHIQQVFLAFLFLACFMFVRKYLILVYPFIVFGIIRVFRLRLNRKGLILIFMILGISLLSSLINGLWLVNNVLSLYIFLPSLVLIMAKRERNTFANEALRSQFWKISSIILLFVNFSALCTFVYTHYSHRFVAPITSDLLDDAFYGLYGKYGLGGHILSVLNIIYAVRFFFVRRFKLALTFLICSILGFYGLGLLLAILSLLVSLRKRILSRGSLKVVFAAVTLMALSVGVIRTINRHNYDYIKNTLMSFVDNASFDYHEEMKKANNFQTTSVPRKITFYKGVGLRIMETPSILLLGTSPGTYNSRTAFLLNGDISRTKMLRDNVKKRPPYHQIDVFPLFNTITTRVPWMGGTRNQPFSSVISIFMEYGFLLGTLIMLVFYRFGSRVIKEYKETLDYYPLQFILIYTFFLSFFVYYFDLIEYSLPILILLKIYEIVPPKPILNKVRQS